MWLGEWQPVQSRSPPPQMTTLPTSSITSALTKKYEERGEGPRNIMIVGGHPLIITFDLCDPVDIPQNISDMPHPLDSATWGQRTHFSTHHMEGTQECLQEYRKEYLILITIFIVR